MNEEQITRIKNQLKLRTNKLYCSHNIEQPCKEGRIKITDDVRIYNRSLTLNEIKAIYNGGITGDFSRIRGDVTGIIGNALEIKEILEELKE